MNRKNLTAAVLAGLAGVAGVVGSAQAVNINPDGLGQVLVYPYYSTNAGNVTLLSVVNTTGQAKAVKVRFLEGQNSQEVLDFNLYMSKYDVWAAAIVGGDAPALVINDTTCTVPYLYMNDMDGDGVRDGMTAFLPWELDDGGLFDISRATEGHFEMIEMGTLIDPDFGSATAATHVDGMPPDSWIAAISLALFAETGNDIYKAPRTCGQLADAWTDPNNLVNGDEGYWYKNPLEDMLKPSGGLYGGASVVQPADGTMYSYNATAINGFSDSVYDGSSIFDLPLHTPPGELNPNLNSGDILDAAVFTSNGNVAEATLDRGVDAVSYVFMHDQVMNGYSTETVVEAGTEWVITFPTKHFYVFEPNLTGLLTAPLAPFTSKWDETLTDESAEACEVVVLDRLWDREEQTPGTVPGVPVPPIVSPAPPDQPTDGTPAFTLCYETSVIRFGDVTTKGDATEILGSTNFVNIDNVANGFESGWARIQLADYPETDADGDIVPGGDTLMRSLPVDSGLPLAGLPVAGFAVNRFGNSNAGGGALKATYGAIFDHRYTRRIGSFVNAKPKLPIN